MSIEPICTAPEEHSHTMELARLDMPSGDTMMQLAEQFKLLGDPTRIKILWSLSQGAMCVCDLAQLLGSSQSAISHQLRLLRQARLVKYEKNGRSSVYMLDDEHVWQIIRLGLNHVLEERGGAKP